LRRTQTDEPNALASPSLSNAKKATKAIGGMRDEEQRRITLNFFKI
jgi:hypothetical protein